MVGVYRRNGEDAGFPRREYLEGRCQILTEVEEENLGLDPPGTLLDVYLRGSVDHVRKA